MISTFPSSPESVKINFVPDTVDSAADWVGQQILEGQQFRIRGNGTMSTRDPYQTTEAPDRQLSTRLLTETLFFDPDDLVAGMEAGQTAAGLQGLLADQKMLLPVNPWYPESTLGGMVSTNVCGPNRMNMGGLRDALIGIEYINGQGERVHAGGKVVKNVSGYDLTRMMIGHLGGLGLITSVNFKIQSFALEPHAIFMETTSMSWRNTVAQLHGKRIPLDWIQAVSLAQEGSGLLLGIGFSGNHERRGRIASEIREAAEGNFFLLAEGEASPDWSCLPGQDRFTGFLPPFLKYWDMLDPALHVLTTLPTSVVLEMPLEKLDPWNPQLIIHPVGADIHFFLKDVDPLLQQEFLETLKKSLPEDQSNIKLVRASPGCSAEDLGDFAKPPGYALSRRLKQYLDPRGIFHAPYYLMN